MPNDRLSSLLGRQSPRGSGSAVQLPVPRGSGFRALRQRPEQWGLRQRKLLQVRAHHLGGCGSSSAVSKCCSCMIQFFIWRAGEVEENQFLMLYKIKFIFQK